MPLFTLPAAYFAGLVAAAGKLRIQMWQQGTYDTAGEVRVEVDLQVGGLRGPIAVLLGLSGAVQLCSGESGGAGRVLGSKGG